MLHTYYNMDGTVVEKITVHVSLVAYFAKVVIRYYHDKSRNHQLL